MSEKVYLLFEDWECTNLMGVYGTREKAEQSVETFGGYIEEYDIN